MWGITQKFKGLKAQSNFPLPKNPPNLDASIDTYTYVVLPKILGT